MRKKNPPQQYELIQNDDLLNEIERHLYQKIKATELFTNKR